MSVLSAQEMSGLLTLPYGRGAELMEIPIGADAAGFTNIPAYDFKEYRARYQSDPPQPKYVLFPRTNIGGDEMEIEVEFSSVGPPATTVVRIPARTLAEISFVVPLPPAAAATRARFRQLPLPLPGPVHKSHRCSAGKYLQAPSGRERRNCQHLLDAAATLPGLRTWQQPRSIWRRFAGDAFSSERALIRCQHIGPLPSE
jgi:hypothetical protein